ncbi:hypothetical protein [Marinospirillum sp.]|uniref:hypothetical protein n=1 Tax=Marinospirillum sp. TaxID=2183934 RepID=UPI00385029B0
MVKVEKANIWTTPQAKMLASGLIQKMWIRQGYGLAIYLGLEPFYDNYSAVELWIQRMLAIDYDQAMNLDFLQDQLVGLVPEDMQGELD